LIQIKFDLNQISEILNCDFNLIQIKFDCNQISEILNCDFNLIQIKFDCNQISENLNCDFNLNQTPGNAFGLKEISLERCHIASCSMDAHTSTAHHCAFRT